MNRARPAAVATLAGLALGALLLTACAVLPQRQRAEDPVLTELRQRVLELQKKAVIAEAEIDRLRQQVASLERRAPTSTSPAQSAPPRPESAPARIATAAPPPRPTIEERELPAPEQRSPRVAPPPAPGRIAPTDAAPKAEVGPATAPASAPPVREGSTALQLETASAEARVLYDQAYASFHQGRFVDSETAFRRFLQQFPATDLSDNAAYWIGECRYARGDMKAALSAFQEAIERFPSGNKVPDALYKAGLSLESLGDAASARESYREIVTRFPESGAAALAQERLRELP
jgi:tol-pal system protein YbgF